MSTAIIVPGLDTARQVGPDVLGTVWFAANTPLVFGTTSAAPAAARGEIDFDAATGLRVRAGAATLYGVNISGDGRATFVPEDSVSGAIFAYCDTTTNRTLRMYVRNQNAGAAATAEYQAAAEPYGGFLVVRMGRAGAGAGAAIPGVGAGEGFLVTDDLGGAAIPFNMVVGTAQFSDFSSVGLLKLAVGGGEIARLDDNAVIAGPHAGAPRHSSGWETLRVSTRGVAGIGGIRLDDRSNDPAANAGGGYVYTKLSAGTSQLFYRDSAGAITQLTPAGGAPVNAQYLCLIADATLTQERVFTPSTGMTAVDGGAGLAYTVTVDLSTGVAGGQTAIGGTAGADAFTIQATSNVAGGSINLQGVPGTTVLEVTAASQVVVGGGVVTAGEALCVNGDEQLNGSLIMGPGGTVIQADVGATGFPGYAFNVDLTSGMWLDTVSTLLFFTVGGTDAFSVNSSQQVMIGFGGPVGGELLFVGGDAYVQGKLTVTGSVDPTDITLSGGGTAHFMEWADGQTAAVSAASTGRIVYNALTNQFEASMNGGAYAAFGGGGGTLDTAYDFGGAGAGRAITADSGAVQINNSASGADALLLELQNDGAAAAGTGATIDFLFNTSTPALVNFAQLRVYVEDEAAASPKGRIVLMARDGAGALAGPYYEIDPANNNGIHRWHTDDREMTLTNVGLYLGETAAFPNALLHVEQGPKFGGNATVAIFFGGAHTGLDATSETVDVHFDLDRTVQHLTGAIALQRAVRISNPTYSFVGASTIATAATVYIEGAPVAGANATITSKYALYSNAGIGLNGGLRLVERADHEFTPTATFGEIWLKNTTPNTLYFTDDAGTDWLLNQGPGGVTLDGAYDFGGAGVGRTITADSGAVQINNAVADATNALELTRTVGTGYALQVRNNAAPPTIMLRSATAAIPNLLDLLNDGAAAVNTGVIVSLQANNSTPLPIGYAQLEMKVLDTTAGNEDGQFALNVMSDGVMAVSYRMNGLNDLHQWFIDAAEQMRLTTSGLGIHTTTVAYRLDVRDTVGAVANFQVDSSGTIIDTVTIRNLGAAAVGTGSILSFQANNATPTNTVYARFQGDIRDTTAAAEYGRMRLDLANAGTLRTVYEVDESANVHIWYLDNLEIGRHTPAGLSITQRAQTTGSPTALLVTGAAHTTLAAGTEATDIDFNLNRTVQFATGAIALQRAVRFQSPTYAFVGASTITDAATVYIGGAPAAGANATITSKYALYSNAGIGLNGGLRFEERADHEFTPTAGKGELWVRNDTPNVLVFTDDAGTDTVLGAGGGGAPVNAQYLCLIADATLTQERVFTPSTGLTAVDGGAGAAYTLTANLSTGVAGGQAAIGGTGAGENVTIRATSNVAGGSVIFEIDGTPTEVARFDSTGLGIGTTPAFALHIVRAANAYAVMEGTDIEATVHAYRNSLVPAADDIIGQFGFRANNDTPLPLVYARMIGTIRGKTTGSEYGRIALLQMDAGTERTTYECDEQQNYHIWYIGGAEILRTEPAGLTVTQQIRTGGSPSALLVTGAAHTTLAASTEASDANLNLARTVQFATGALATQRAVKILAPTYAFVGASTITNAATLAISGAPAQGANCTITNSYALWIQSGAMNLDGDFKIGAVTLFESDRDLSVTLMPNGDDTIDLGTAGRRFRSLYATDPQFGDVTFRSPDGRIVWKLTEDFNCFRITDLKTGRKGRLPIIWEDEGSPTEVN